MAFWSAILVYPLTLNHRRERHEGVKQRFARFCLRCGSRAVTLDSIYARLCLESGIERSAHREPTPIRINQIALKPAGFMVKSRQVLRFAPYHFLILARATQRASFSRDMGVSSAFYLPVNQSLTVNSPVVCRKRTKLRMRYRNDDFEKISLWILFFSIVD
ncbi:hypothetical protein V202x_16280 [Gimesia aquarii]|uniref:Uncharacterized protein n=1 Tax=Gimesia aquarii TaxID=2527964 RepID=A0A517WSM4_9PLAN|nr:hypothetical protein V202x_16280 [Gimesia aquarii]